MPLILFCLGLLNEVIVTSTAVSSSFAGIATVPFGVLADHCDTPAGEGGSNNGVVTNEDLLTTRALG